MLQWSAAAIDSAALSLLFVVWRRRSLRREPKFCWSERRRVTTAPGILEHYDALADRAAGVVRAEVLTAVPVDNDVRERIASTLEKRLGGRVHTTVTHDPSILGGLVIRVGDRVIDDSLRTHLRQLQTALA